MVCIVRMMCEKKKIPEGAATQARPLLVMHLYNFNQSVLFNLFMVYLYVIVKKLHRKWVEFQSINKSIIITSSSA